MNAVFTGLKRLPLVFLAASTLFIAACQHGNEPDPQSNDASQLVSTKERNESPVYEESELSQLVSDNNAFAFDLYHAIGNQADNVLFSPHSISVALAMTYAGARNQTEAQMAEILRFNFPQAKLHSLFNALDLELRSRKQNNSVETGKYLKLKIANAIWTQEGYRFLDEFLDILMLNYGAGIWLADFQSSPGQARSLINDWVARQTEQKIRELLEPNDIDSDTRLVLTNTVYFNAAWAIPFDPKFSYTGDFYRTDGSITPVSMMIPEKGSGQNGETYAATVGSGYQAVELPYYGGEFSMLIVMPDQGTFAAFEERLDGPLIDEIVNDLQERAIALRMPKFKYESRFQLRETLYDMGMRDAFVPGVADLSGMDGSHNLCISKAIHQAMISVDEAGTEASAATAVVITYSDVPNPLEIIINRPFIYLIRDIKTGTILFLGRVTDPDFVQNGATISIRDRVMKGRNPNNVY